MAAAEVDEPLELVEQLRTLTDRYRRAVVAWRPGSR